jgi:ATP-dependent DNA ligase
LILLLPTLVEKPPEGDDWIHEVKFDGYRSQIIIDEEGTGPAPKGMKRPATQWVKPGLIGRVKHLRGEADLRHASLQDFREE